VSGESQPYVGWYGAARHQNWGTPLDLFDGLHREFAFDLDGAADNGNALLADASRPDAPVDWTGRRVFCNPPWSAIPPFIEQAARASLAVLLVPARVNARWFHRALELGAEPRFFLGRPAFRHHEPRKGHNSPVDCLLLVFGKTERACVFCSDQERAGPCFGGSKCMADGLDDALDEYYVARHSKDPMRLNAAKAALQAILTRIGDS
jgi:hypothetical protein